MNISDLMIDIKGDLKQDSLMSFEDIIAGDLFNENHSEEDFINASDFLGVELNELYVVENSFISPYIYLKDYIYMDIFSVELDILESFRVKDMISQATNQIMRKIESRDFTSALMYMNEKIRFNSFIELSKSMNSKEKYEAFKYVYVSNEYGFELFSKDEVKEIFSYKEKNIILQDLEENDIEIDNDGFVKIYRGEASKSTSKETAYSWTTDFEVAETFAYRYNSLGTVYEGEIHSSKILDFIVDRNESEVICLYEDIFLIEAY